MTNKKNKIKSLLVIKNEGKLSGNYYRYKYLIKEKFQVSQIRPYVLEFPKKLDDEEKNYISDLLNKSEAEHKWYFVY